MLTFALPWSAVPDRTLLFEICRRTWTYVQSGSIDDNSRVGLYSLGDQLLTKRVGKMMVGRRFGVGAEGGTWKVFWSLMPANFLLRIAMDNLKNAVEGTVGKFWGCLVWRVMLPRKENRNDRLGAGGGT